MSETEIVTPVTDTALPGEAGETGSLPPREIAVTPAKSKTLVQRIFSFPAMLGALLVGGVAIIAQNFFVDPDVWWHIKQGEVIIATHHVTTTDAYSLTLAGRPWAAYEWLGDVLLATTYRLGAMRGLELLLLILGSAILISLYGLATIHSGNSKAAFVSTAAVAALAAISFNLRPQMLGYTFLILTFIALERFRQGHRRAVWALPILMVIWVNAHGSWIIGLGVIGIYLASGLVGFRVGELEARKWSSSDRYRLACVFLLSCFATIVTPYGAALAKYPFDVAFSLPLGVANVVEWQSMPFNMAAGKLFLALLISAIVLQLIYRLNWRLEILGLFIFATIMACLHIRFLLIFVPVMAPILAVILARWTPRYDASKDQYLVNAVVMGAILAATVWFFPSQKNLWQQVGKTYPVAAVEYLNDQAVPEPMYDTYGFGGYLILSRGPEHKVFMDGRSELYERGGVLADYLEVSFVKPGAIAVLQKYGFRSCLLHHDEPFATVLAALPEWQKVYEDGTSILFVRRSDSQVSEMRDSGAANAATRRE
jgi:hypothetical protein